MRVIGGRLGGRKLRRVPNGVRPTTDRVRESLFAILGAVHGSAVLDICAGSGALGIEALSRGASRVVAIEKAAGALAAIRANSRDLELEDALRVRAGDARSVLRRLGAEGERFDLVLFDPPYDAGLEAAVLSRLVEGDLLPLDARVVVEGAKRHSLPPVPGLEVIDERVYGDTVLRFLIRTDADAAAACP